MTDRDAFVEQLKARIDEWNAEIDRLEARMRKAGEQAEARYRAQLHEMQDSRDEAAGRLEDLQKMNEKAWQDMRVGFNKAWKDIQAAFDKARSSYG